MAAGTFRMSYCFTVVVLFVATALAAPVHEYRFDGGGTDSAGSADGTVGMSVTFSATDVPPCLKTAAVFGVGVGNSTVDEIVVPRADFTGFGVGDFSIAFWVRRDQGDGGTFDGVADALSGTGQGWQIAFNGDDFLFVRLDDALGGTLITTTTSTVTEDGIWHHVALSVDRDQAAGLTWYVDGVLDATHDPTGVPGTINPNQNLRIGAFNNSSGLDGALGQLQFYDRALTSGEVTVLFAAGTRSGRRDPGRYRGRRRVFRK